MAQSASLFSLPTREATGEEMDATQATAPQMLEDIRLAERVARALSGTGHGPLRGIAVTVRAREVTLEGRVPSYYLKQLAQASALAVPGAHRVRNDLDVGRAS